MGIDSTQIVAPAALPGWHDGPAKQAVLEQARKDGWTVVSIRDDWASVFGPA